MFQSFWLAMALIMACDDHGCMVRGQGMPPVYACQLVIAAAPDAEFAAGDGVCHEDGFTDILFELHDGDRHVLVPRAPYGETADVGAILYIDDPGADWGEWANPLIRTKCSAPGGVTYYPELIRVDVDELCGASAAVAPIAHSVPQ